MPEHSTARSVVDDLCHLDSDYDRSHKLSIFRIISLAHCTDAAINWSVRGLPCRPPNRSSAVRMCRLVRIAAIMAITRLRPSSTRPYYNVRLMFATSGCKLTYLDSRPKIPAQ